jgi:hypothetical protein
VKFLDQLLEVNSSRVHSDVDERVGESRKKLEVEIKGVLREASTIADRALAHARAERRHKIVILIVVNGGKMRTKGE